jgi:hypothetical protein
MITPMKEFIYDKPIIEGKEKMLSIKTVLLPKLILPLTSNSGNPLELYDICDFEALT